MSYSHFVKQYNHVHSVASKNQLISVLQNLLYYYEQVDKLNI